MMKWSLFGEFLSLCILVLMYSYYREKNAVLSFRRRVFYWIFRLSAASIVLNIVSVYTMENHSFFPLWLNIGINTLYFILIVVVCSIIALYVFDLMLEQVPGKQCYRNAVGGLAFLCLAFGCVAVSNIWNNVLFYFTPDGHYIRGPWNRLGYGVMSIEILMMLLCYYKNHSLIPRKVVRVIRSLPPVALVLTGFQFLYPETQMNGTIMAAAVYILYSNFQLCQIEKDSLTQLGNRKTFLENISIKMKNAQPFQIVSVSLRQFGGINQKYGNIFGDALLRMLAEWLEAFPGADSAYRISNVEFVVVFPYLEMTTAEKNSHDICSRFQDEWKCRDNACRLDACVCDLIWQGEHWTASQLIEYLQAMKRRPECREKKPVRFDSLMAEKLERTKYVEEVLKTAFREKLFSIALQPFFCCREHTFCCGEALARLSDFDRRPIPAGEFIPVSERMEMLDTISWVVLEKVCEFLASHREFPVDALSVNLSMEQFLDPAFPDKVCEMLDRFEIPFSKLKIEITEHVIAQDLNYVKNVMCTLRKKGIGFYLDDFGSGYSNFSALMQLPFESVKLDRSLLSGILESAENRNMMRHMITFFHASGFRVICEGVETEAQSEIMTKLGADMIQGFYYARPMEPEAFAEFISAVSHDPLPQE